MGGTGSGRKPCFQSELVFFAMDVQMKAFAMMDAIKNKKASFDEVYDQLVDLNKYARRICEENERLK